MTSGQRRSAVSPSRVLSLFPALLQRNGDEHAPKRARATDRWYPWTARNTADASTTAHENNRTPSVTRVTTRITWTLYIIYYIWIYQMTTNTIL